MIGAFQNLLSDLSDRRPSLNSLDFDRIGVEEATRLEEAFYGGRCILCSLRAKWGQGT